MARLQDFPSVTPTSSDNLLIVQSQGQGLANFGTVMGAKMNSANPTGTGALSINRKANTTVGGQSVTLGTNGTASGDQAVSEGNSTVASGNQSHAEGYLSTASGLRSHAEGQSTTASGNCSHAEGYQTTASGGNYGYGSHAEGQSTTASGQASHSEGYNTIANHFAQHVFGSCNAADTSTAAATSKGNYVEIVGNGSSDANRSNARTLDWSGNEMIAGDLTFNGNKSLTSTVDLFLKMVDFQISANNGTKNVVVTPTSNDYYSFLVVANARNSYGRACLLHVSGYVTASRAQVTNITGLTGLTIDTSSTTDYKFVFTNTTANVMDVRIIPLLSNSFTVT